MVVEIVEIGGEGHHRLINFIRPESEIWEMPYLLSVKLILFSRSFSLKPALNMWQFPYSDDSHNQSRKAHYDNKGTTHKIEDIFSRKGHCVKWSNECVGETAGTGCGRDRRASCSRMNY